MGKGTYNFIEVCTELRNKLIENSNNEVVANRFFTLMMMHFSEEYGQKYMGMAKGNFPIIYECYPVQDGVFDDIYISSDGYAIAMDADGIKMWRFKAVNDITRADLERIYEIGGFEERKETFIACYTDSTPVDMVFNYSDTVYKMVEIAANGDITTKLYYNHN